MIALIWFNLLPFKIVRTVLECRTYFKNCSTQSLHQSAFFLFISMIGSKTFWKKCDIWGFSSDVGVLFLLECLTLESDPYWFLKDYITYKDKGPIIRWNIYVNNCNFMMILWLISGENALELRQLKCPKIDAQVCQ